MKDVIDRLDTIIGLLETKKIVKKQIDKKPPVGRTKLSKQDVIEIKKMRQEGLTCSQISEKYGISIPSVSLITKGKRLSNFK
jgi:hypothetical protein